MTRACSERRAGRMTPAEGDRPLLAVRHYATAHGMTWGAALSHIVRVGIATLEARRRGAYAANQQRTPDARREHARRAAMARWQQQRTRTT